ncbi:surface-adhesin E family protein [Nitrosomonas communis]|uniref:Surface-adhesin protein E-like domain-containing protein n=1 Tax=Nitrosomonas communis TaxID=44574 RepID=A0A1I4S311_9PROT|nr:surface-adhesin E family protein [Nitrosomonas communis]SFM58898.1 hypothetical protein SAMN05421863_103717 [Nitrosomonas communis]
MIIHLITKLSFTLLLVLMTNNAVAEWKLAFNGMFRNKKIQVYLDYDRIRKSGDTVKIWELVDFPEGSELVNNLSVKSLTEFDCLDERHRSLYKVFYTGNMGEGRVDFSVDTPSNWAPIIPETVTESLWKEACGKQDFETQTLSMPLPAAPDWESSGWMEVYRDNSFIRFHIYPSSIQKNNRFGRVWTLFSCKTDTSSRLYHIRRILYEFDCDNKRVKVVDEKFNDDPNPPNDGGIRHIRMASRPTIEEWKGQSIEEPKLWGTLKNDLFYNICNR